MKKSEIPAFPSPLVMRRSFGSEIGKQGGRNSFVETVSPGAVAAAAQDTLGTPVPTRAPDGDDMGEPTPTAAKFKDESSPVPPSPSIDGPEKPAPDTTAELADSLMSSLPVAGGGTSRLGEGRDSVSSMDSMSSAGTATSTSFWTIFPRISQLHSTPHARWAVVYLVPRLSSC